MLQKTSKIGVDQLKNNGLYRKRYRVGQIWLALMLFVGSSFLVFGQNKHYRYLDSADAYLEYDLDKCLAFLKKIPDPKEVTMKGKVAEYYETLGFVYYHKDNFGLAYRYLMQSAKYAEKEKKYKLAGGLYVELYNINIQINGKPNNNLLEQATNNYKKVNYEDGLTEVLQAQIYSHFVSHEHEKCLKLSLHNLSEFNNCGDPFISLVANFMISSTYLQMDSLEKGHSFYNAIQKYRDTSIIDYIDFAFNDASLKFDISEYHFRHKNLDSALHYFKKITPDLKYLDYTMETEYYELGAGIYRLANQPEMAKAYSDSLVKFINANQESVLKESLETNEKLVDASENLSQVNSENKFYRLNLILLGVLSLSLLLLLFVFRLKVKSAALALKTKIEDTFSLKKDQQKLTTQINQLEAYIAEVKTEVKNISQEESIPMQRELLQKLYTQINLKINESSDKDHLLVVNEMNQEFFEKLSAVHPDLSESEKLICYYLALGFKNKEVASFLNTTVRSVEGRRFRLKKKINLEGDNKDFVQYLMSYLKKSDTDTK